MFSAGEEVHSQLFTSLKESSGAAVSPALELSLTAVYTVLYSLLFVFVYLQLWLILHYGHKRFSYQSVFLFLCLLWAALRTTLFSFYFKNVVQANQLQPLAYWLLYCFPVCLQFFTLCLLNLYFTQVRVCVRDVQGLYEIPDFIKLLTLQFSLLLALNASISTYSWSGMPLSTCLVQMSVTGDWKNTSSVKDPVLLRSCAASLKSFNNRLYGCCHYDVTKSCL